MGDSDFFSGPTTWINEPKSWALANGVMSVDVESCTDFFIDEEGPSTRSSAHFCYREVAGDFDFSIRAKVDMSSPFDSACIMMMSNETHWAKLCYENWTTGPSIVSVVTRDFSDDCPSYVVGECEPYLRALRSRNNFGFFYSLNNLDWTIVRYFNLAASEKLKLGVAFQCPVGSKGRISASVVRFEKRTIATARAT